MEKITVRLDGVADGAPSSPTNLTAQAQSDGISLSWDAPEASDLSSYNIYRQQEPFEEGGGTAGLVSYTQVSAGETTFLDSDVESGTTYYYRVTAVDDGQCESNLSGSASTSVGGAGRVSFTLSDAGLGGFQRGSTSLGDLDGDGTLDLVVIGETDNAYPTTRVYLGDGAGKFNVVENPVLDGKLTGVRTGSISLGDLDEDGTLDLIVTGSDGNDGTARVYLGDGAGKFSVVENPVPDGQIAEVSFSSTSLGDLDGDGTLDLVITGFDENESGSPTTRVYLGDGAGKFNVVENPVPDGKLTDVSSGPTSLGDLDGDGTLDLVVTGLSESDEETARVYLGDGDGKFNVVENPLSDGKKFSDGSTSLGDLDGDGTLDLIITGFDENESGSTTTSVYLGDGDGKFNVVENPVPDGKLIGVGDNNSTSLGDLDGDGTLDLVVTGGYNARVYLGDGDGKFNVVENPVPDGKLIGVSYDASNSLGDLDGDGTLDLIVTGRGEDGLTARVYLNDGDDDGGDDSLPGVITGNFTASVVEGGIQLDWDPSNAEDLSKYRLYRDTSSIDQSTDPSTLTPLDSTEAGTTTFLDEDVMEETTYYYRITAVDDAGNESPLSTEQATATPGKVVRITQVEPTSGAPGTKVQISGTGFTEDSDDFVPQSAIDSVAFGDTRATVEGVLTGQATVKVPEGPSGPVEVTVTAGGVSATAPSPFTVVTGGAIAFSDGSPALPGVKLGASDWGDFDGDGDLDVVLTGETSDGPFITAIYRNEGDGTFSPVSGTVDGPPVGVRHGTVEWGDYNGDGRPDLVVAGQTAARERVAKIYRNKGGGTFSAIGAGLPGVVFSGAGWGDADGDGDLDLALTGDAGAQGRIARIYENKGGGTFEAVGADLTGVAFGSVNWGNYNEFGSSQKLVLTGSTGDSEVTIVYDRFFNAEHQLTGVTGGEARWGDLGNDGDLDLTVVGTSGDDGRVAKIYRADSTRSGVNLEEMDTELEGVSDGSVRWGDFDGDEDLDLIVAGGRSTEEGQKTEARIYENDDGTFVPMSTGLAGASLGGVSTGDYNGDGTLDLLLAGHDGQATATRVYQGLENTEGAGLSARTTASLASEQTVGLGEAKISFSGVRSPGPVSVARYARAPGAPEKGIDNPVVQNTRLVVRTSETTAFDSATVRLPRNSSGRGLSRQGMRVYQRLTPGQGTFEPVPQTLDVTASSVAFTTEKPGEFALASSGKGPIVRVKTLDATPDGDQVQLRWETASSPSKVRFVVQRRADRQNGSADWTEVTTVNGKEGKTSYTATDPSVPYAADSLAYRLQEIGPDNQTSQTRSVEVRTEAPSQVRLKALYPNPARERATVQFAVPQAQDVSLKLYDTLGRHVRTVLAGEKQGRHEMRIDTSELSSGIYFLRFSTEGTVKTKRLTVIQ